MCKRKFNYFVDLIDLQITTGKVNPFYKGFKTLKKLKNILLKTI